MCIYLSAPRDLHIHTLIYQAKNEFHSVQYNKTQLLCLVQSSFRSRQYLGRHFKIPVLIQSDCKVRSDNFRPLDYLATGEGRSSPTPDLFSWQNEFVSYGQVRLKFTIWSLPDVWQSLPVHATEDVETKKMQRIKIKSFLHYS